MTSPPEGGRKPVRSLVDRSADFILGYPRGLIAVFLILTAVFGFYLTRIEFDTSVESMILEDDPVYRTFEEALDEFGTSELQVILLEAPDIFAPGVLEAVDRITRRLREVEYVEAVLSLSNALDISGDEEGLVIKPLVEEFPLRPEESARIRERARANPLLRNSLVSPDGKVTSINAKLAHLNRVEDPFYFLSVMDDIRTILAEEAPDRKFHLAGVAVLAETTTKAVQEDTRTFVGITVVLILVALFLIFRSAPEMYIPMTVVGVAVVWAMGFFTLMGRKIGSTSEMIPVLVMVYCLSDTIHLISRYYEESRGRESKVEALSVSLRHLLLACLMTSITTAIGFSTLAISKLKPVRDFGIYASVGILFAYFISIVIPSLFYRYLRPPRRERQLQLEAGFLGRLLERVGRINQRHPRLVLILSGLIMAGSILGIFRLRVETNLLEMLSRGGDLQKDYVFADQRMGGVTPLQVVIRGEDQIAKDPRVLAQVERLEKFLRDLPEIGKVTTLNSFLRQMNRVLHEGKEEFYRVPEDRNTIAQFIELYSLSGGEETIGEFVNFDRTGLQVVARLVNCHSSTRQYQIVRAIREFAAGNFDPGLEVEITGLVSIYAITVDYLIRSLGQSVVLTFVMISILMALMVRSLRVGILIMIPNVVPIVLTLGIMGWAGITLNMATVTIAAVAMGIAVDSTIHYVARFRTELRRDDDYVAAMYRALRGTGRAIIFATLVISAGFVVNVFSNFLPNIYFGALMGFTMLGAMLGDLFILPVLFLLFRPRFKQSLIDTLEMR